jgi:NADH-quinone oxidoreductase subunit J
MSLAEIAFYILAGLGVAAALGVVLTRNVVHAALFLLGTLLVVAAMFLALQAEFLALVQILIYGGAVTILLLFAIMLTRAGGSEEVTNPRRPWRAGVPALAVFAVLVAGILTTPWPTPTPNRTLPITTFGADLFSTWALPFEIVSLVLLAALIGGIIIARTDERE